MGWESKRRQLNWKLVHELQGPLREAVVVAGWVRGESLRKSLGLG